MQADDRVECSFVRIVPAEVHIGFSIEDPYGDVILKADEIKQREFAFDAATSGNYRLKFSINPTLLTNALLFVEVRHRAPEQFLHLGGTYVAVEHGKLETVNVSLNFGDRLQGSFTIQGGDGQLLFSITDPSGNIVGWAGMVTYSHSFAIKTNTSGQFQIRFDNALSSYISKLVTLEYSVSR